MSETVAEDVWITLSDPDITTAELRAVAEALQAAHLNGGGPNVEAFEAAFARYIGRRHAIAVPSGTIGMLLALKASGIGPGDEVIAAPYSWRETTHAVALAGATPVFADIDYWAGTLVPAKAEARITPRTRAILAGNPNGHPAPWAELRDLAGRHGLKLIEDSTEALGSVYRGAPVGSFGDCAVFDFSQPGPLVCGEGGMIVTDDASLASTLRRHRARRIEERSSVVLGMVPPLQAEMSEMSAALGLVQLQRIDAILARRKLTQSLYGEFMQSFEGIKPPYVGADVDEAHWFLYVVHLGTRFTKSSRDAIVEDLRTENVQAAAYSQPLHLQPFYFALGFRRGQFLVTEKVADRAVALPFHGHLTKDHVEFIVGTMKDASVNVGAGAAIY
jgi:dTDP-4-amino-4,6-dideoxygalactose transaminase